MTTHEEISKTIKALHEEAESLWIRGANKWLFGGRLESRALGMFEATKRIERELLRLKIIPPQIPRPRYIPESADRPREFFTGSRFTR